MSLYHYTDLNGMRGILEHKVLWLTHYKYLNDTEEFSHFYDDVVKAIDIEVEDRGYELDEWFDPVRNYSEMANLFIASFCEDEGDLLSQWRGYSKGNVGYSIEFCENEIKKLESLYLEECLYETSEKNELKTSIVNDFFNGKEINRLLNLSARYKNEGFKEEKEKRLWVLLPIKDDAPIQTEIHFREKKGVLVPYIKVPFEEKWIKSVTIGPSRDQDLAEKSLRYYLDSKNYKNVKIKKSKIPYSE